MRVGVAVPARDVLPYIETLLTTVRAQTYPCAAYIVDDASTDGTTGFLTARPSWYRRLAVHEEQQGWPAALNHAVRLAVGDGCDAVFTANADDFLRLDCIERCVRALACADWVTPWTQQVGGLNVVQASPPITVDTDLVDHCPAVAFALVRADMWTALGGYDADVNVPGLTAGYNEWDWQIRAHRAGCRHAVVEEPVVYYRVHPAQLSHATTARHAEAVALLRAKHPSLPWPTVEGL